MLKYTSLILANLNKSIFQDLTVGMMKKKPVFKNQLKGENCALRNNMSVLNFSSSGNTFSNTRTFDDNNVVWVDLEMTGLDPEQHHIIEVACLVTDGQLNILEEGPDLIIHQPPDVLQKMNEWCVKQHGESGLTEECKNSNISIKDAELQLLEFVRKWAPVNKCPLGGNTIYMDRLFLRKYMPDFEQHMHYRIIDVSSVKELCRRWYPDIYSDQPNKKQLSKHRALEDIKSSIAELKFYKENIFIAQN